VSLIDPSLPAPSVPASVFTIGAGGTFWLVTLNASNPHIGGPYLVSIENGNVSDSNQTGGHSAWCVRGGMIADAY